jgi:hypothetical protein
MALARSLVRSREPSSTTMISKRSANLGSTTSKLSIIGTTLSSSS